MFGSGPPERVQNLRTGEGRGRARMKQDCATRDLLDEAGKLWAEAGSVIAMRTARINRCDADAGTEMVRMVTEKVWAGWELGIAFAMGQLGHDPETVCRHMVSHYRREVRKNLRRLSAND
ncbi:MULTISPECIES: hypothetical protein [Novosphingobium]|jgi:hypothetical protein|uniref:Uncharacterized protein n=1 Tax=Novosphingobium panipatense TaxID=428991 RepID=A0ABY1QB45_9SPHN|nr:MULTISPECIES: hypothetical protein [Novosphingobium]SMP62173.1 hypothetical protein SAMN06296065_103416 [Novosphingobium panipatense]